MGTSNSQGETLRKLITDYALCHGFDLIGFTSAESFTRTREEMQTRVDAGIYPHGLAESDLELRTNPEKVLPGAQTIISLATAYSTVEPEEIKPGEMRGILSRYAWGMDYHHYFPPRLNQLIAYIETLTDHRFHFVAMADTGPLSDRAVAERAGIGFIGWNSNLITPTYGSWVFLAEIVTDLPLPPDEPLDRTCYQCGRCLDACPTGAIYAPYKVNPFRCLSYITQMKEDIPDEYRPAMGNRLFGCDTCQAVCPHNQEAQMRKRPEFFPGPLGTAPNLAELLTISNAAFKRTYGTTAAGWRGKRVLQRNAAIILGNQQSEAALPYLAAALKDPKPQVQRAARWAIQRIQQSNPIHNRST